MSEVSLTSRRHPVAGLDYKWIALSNTTLGVLMASLNSSIMIISLPAIFNGLHINPLIPANTGYLLWLLLGYMIVSAISLVTFGRLSDMFGRVRLYNLGFLIFTLGSVALYLSSLTISGTRGALALILLRLVQGFGGAFLSANSAAILTDAFPAQQRGLAMGINQIAAIGGGLIGLVLGGILSAVDWHLIFLVSVPVGLFGTVWAYVALREIATVRRGQRLDPFGNVSFALGLTVLLIGFTYSIEPYGHSTMGWGNPLVLFLITAGVLLLGVFVWWERHAPDPMFRLSLFRIRAFAAGNISTLLAGIARGGLQFMLVIWLQGIWLPMHGVAFVETPLHAAIDMIPLMAGFLVVAPLSGWFSDRAGARVLATAGMLINVVGFILLAGLPSEFVFWPFAGVIFLLGVGQGMFSAPNTAAVMNSVPPEHRGAASGMSATFLNASMMLSIAVFFTILVVRLAARLPQAMYAGLTGIGLPAKVALQVSQLPPIAALFAALLGYNPMSKLVSPSTLAQLPTDTGATMLSNHFFPSLIGPPFMDGMRTVLTVAAGMALVAAFASALRGRAYVHGAQGSRADTRR